MDSNIKTPLCTLSELRKTLDDKIAGGLLYSLGEQLKILDERNLTFKSTMLKELVEALIKSLTEFQDNINAPDGRYFFNNLKLDINEIILYVINDSIMNYVDDLFIPFIDNKIAEINKVSSLNIDKYSMYQKFGYWQAVYDELKEIHINVMYDKDELDPLLILERLLCSYSLIIQFDEDDEKWLYRFTDDSLNIATDFDIHVCEDLPALLLEIAGILMPDVVKCLKTKETYYRPQFMEPFPEKDIDFKLIKKMNTIDLYDYLSKYISVRVNIQELKYLYFLIFYRKLGFGSAKLIKRTKKWITHNFHHDNSLDIKRNTVFYGFRVSPDKIPDVDGMIFN